MTELDQALVLEALRVRCQDLEIAIRNVCTRWRQEYHCCDGLMHASHGTGVPAKHSPDCPYVAACMLVDLIP